MKKALAVAMALMLLFPLWSCRSDKPTDASSEAGSEPDSYAYAIRVTINPQMTLFLDAQNQVMNDLRAHFRPEFLNRLDETIMFKPLTKDNIGAIIQLMMSDLNRRLEDRQITVELTGEAQQAIIDGGYDPVYGARPLKRYLQKYVETLSARLILSGDVGEGDIIEIYVDGSGKLKARVKE